MKKTGGRIKVAVTGCGRFSEPGHLFYYYIHPEAEIVAVCDRNEEAAKKMAARYRVPEYFTDHEEMLEKTHPDAVSICTPTFTHPELVQMTAARGVHIMCEKPMSPSPADGENMIKACREAGVVFHVGYHKRCNRGLIALRDLIRTRKYGDCFQAEIIWRGLSTFGNVPFVNRMFDLAKSLGLSTESFSPGWRFSDDRCPGGVFEVICHQLDLAQWIIGGVKKVQGEAKTLSPDCTRPDHATALLSHENGCDTYITMSHRALSLNEEDRGTFKCEKGNLKYSTDSTRLALVPARILIETDWGLFGRTRSVPVAPEVSLRSFPHYRKLDNFFRDIRGDLDAREQEIVCRGEQALEVDKVVHELLKISGVI